MEAVDLKLHASLPYGSTTPMPEPRVLGGWIASIEQKVHAAFTEIEERNGRIVAVLGGHGDLEVQIHRDTRWRCFPEARNDLRLPDSSIASRL